MESKTGALFLSTVYEGVKILIPKSNKIKSYVKKKNNPNSLPQNSIQTIAEDKAGKLWIETQDAGLCSFDIKNNIWTHFEPNSPKFKIADKSLCRLFFENEKDLLIGTKSSGLYKFDIETNIVTRITGIINGVDASLFYIRIFYELDENYLLVGTRGNGLFLYNRKENKFVKRILYFDKPYNYSANQMLCILKKEKNTYWIGTDFGIYEFDVKNEKILRHYLKDEKNTNSLPQNNVFSIFRDNFNQIWVGTYGGGFCKFDPIKGTFKTWNIRNGFPSNSIMAIVEDNNKILWVTTTNGLVKFNPQTEDFKIYKKENGFPGNEYNTDSATKLSTGEIALGGTNGLIIFNPNDLHENKYIPPIRLTKLLVNNEERKIYPDITVTKEIHLYHEDKIFEIEFAALSYIHAENNKYAYWLEGFNGNWIYCGNSRSATFTNLDPGDYTLHIKGSNNDGYWNEAGISISVIVHPPYWETWWFRVWIVLIIAGILYYFYYLKIEKFKVVEKTRNNIAANLHDEFGGRISSLGRMASALNTINEIKQNNEANIFLDRIEEQSKLIGEDLKDVVWSLQSENDDWKNLMAKFRRFAADLFENAEIAFSIKFDENYPNKNLDPEQRINYLMILKEITNNIVKHSKATKVEITIKFKSEYIFTVISDNGTGFDTSKQYNGLGLKSIGKRLKILSAEHTLLSNVGNGTKWEINVKL